MTKFQSRKKQSRLPIPSLKDLGSVRQIKRRIGQSDVIYDNRDKLAQDIIDDGISTLEGQTIDLATAKISDVMSWDDKGNVQVKATHEISPAVLGAIKKIRVIPNADGHNAIEIEMIDKVRILQTLAKASGLLEQERNIDKPAVVEVKMVGPSDDKK